MGLDWNGSWIGGEEEMWIKRIFCMMLVCVVSVGCLGMSANACYADGSVEEMAEARATGRFNMDISAKKLSRADTDFPLEVGETITIKASYTPFSASVDFGFIAPDGLFYSVNTDDGSIDTTIKVTQRGYYTLAVRNNSSGTISVSGYVNY